MLNYDQKLYQTLAKLRLQLAEEANVPAFTVFHNRSLIQMAEIRPGTKETFLKIHGVGPAKWEKYGQLFLDAIIHYCAECGIPHDNIPPQRDENKIAIQDNQLSPLLEKILDFFRARDWEQFHSPKNLVMVLASEMGELVEPFRWLTEAQSYHLDPKTFEEVSDEIGDLFIVLVYLSHKLGIDPIGASHKKLIKQGKKYPVEASRGKTLKYTHYEATNESQL